MYFSPKTSADGLVFHYDTGNTVRSYLGEPTTNLAYAANSYLNSNSNWWINAGNATFNDNDTSIQKPVIPNVDTSNLRIFSAVVTGTGGNQQLGSTIVTVSPSTTYSFSIYYYFTGTTMQIPPYVRTLVNNDLLAYFAYNGDTNYLNWPRNKWILLKATVTTQANENGIYMSSYTGDTLGEKLAYFGYQVEQKSHCTPLVLGTRSATQGLKDLTAANTINLSNVSFDSNAQMTFDGTNDLITLADAAHLKFSDGSFTVEQVLNISSISGKQRTFSKGSSGWSRGWHAAARPTQWEFELSDGVSTPGNSFLINTATTVGTNHVVWVIESAVTAKLYVNGVQVGSTQTITESVDFATTTSTVGIGAFESGGEYFNGRIPYTRLYARALSASEIQQNFNAIKGRYGL